MKALLAALLAVPLLAGCNTIAGIGKDLSAAGDAISNTAESVEGDMSKSKKTDDSELEGGPRKKS